jgi:DNA-binding transcriptional ArsR family regulator
MVKYTDSRLDSVFAALADSTRRGILAALADGECPVSELAQPYGMSLPGFMKHLRILKDAGLVEREKEGRVVNCTLSAGPMRDAMDWLARYEKFWNDRLDSLARYLEKEKEPWTRPPKSPRSPSSDSSRPARRRSGARSRYPKR